MNSIIWPGPIIEFAFAGNDYRNGNHQHWFDACDFSPVLGPRLLSLEGPRVKWGVRYSVGSGKRRILRVGHIQVRCLGYASWVGNWCWEHATVTTTDATQLLLYLRRRGYQITESEVEFLKQIKEGDRND